MASKFLNLSTDTTLGGNVPSDEIVSSQKALKTYIDSGLSEKQATLVSGTNIKTINSTSLLGSGDISITGLPSQTSQSGKFLTTNGTSASWATVDALPSQSGNSGKYLTTNGSAASWASLSTVAVSGSYNDLSNKPTIPTTTDSVTSESTAALTSGGAYTNLVTSVEAHTTDANKINVTKAGSTSTITINNVANASTATKLGSTTVGGTTTPIYLDNGTPTALSYTIAKSVPSNAVFTDTTYSAGTGLSLSGTTFNHSNSITAGTVGTSSATSGSTLSVPYVTYDAQGHITATGTHTHTVTGFLTSSDVDQTYSGSSTNAQSGVAVKSAIDAAISSVYKPAGSVAFANLPTPGASYEGYVYNVTDAFTTDSRFVEGSGKSYPAGTNVVVITVTTLTLYAWDLTDMGYHPHYTIYTLTQDEPVDYPESQQTAIYNSSGEQITWAYARSQYDYDYIVRNSSKDIQGSSSYKFDVLSGFVDLSGYQPLLVSGTNIKTVNNNSLLGSGNITIDSLPSQSGNSGKFLTTDGSAASWATVDALPSQSGNSGKYLKTNGSSASWSALTWTYDSTTETLTIA